MCSQGAEPCLYIIGRLSCSVNLRKGTLEVGTTELNSSSKWPFFKQCGSNSNVGQNNRLPGGVNYNVIH